MPHPHWEQRYFDEKKSSYDPDWRVVLFLLLVFFVANIGCSRWRILKFLMPTSRNAPERIGNLVETLTKTMFREKYNFSSKKRLPRWSEPIKSTPLPTPFFYPWEQSVLTFTIAIYVLFPKFWRFCQKSKKTRHESRLFLKTFTFRSWASFEVYFDHKPPSSH